MEKWWFKAKIQTDRNQMLAKISIMIHLIVILKEIRWVVIYSKTKSFNMKENWVKISQMIKLNLTKRVYQEIEIKIIFKIIKWRKNTWIQVLIHLSLKIKKEKNISSRTSKKMTYHIIKIIQILLLQLRIKKLKRKFSILHKKRLLKMIEVRITL